MKKMNDKKNMDKLTPMKRRLREWTPDEWATLLIIKIKDPKNRGWMASVIMWHWTPRMEQRGIVNPFDSKLSELAEQYDPNQMQTSKLIRSMFAVMDIPYFVSPTDDAIPACDKFKKDKGTVILSTDYSRGDGNAVRCMRYHQQELAVS